MSVTEEEKNMKIKDDISRMKSDILLLKRAMREVLEAKNNKVEEENADALLDLLED